MAHSNTNKRIYAFPQELTDDKIAWPFISFHVNDESNIFLYFPIPAGLTFSDNMSYSTIDLGIIGDAVVKTYEGAASGGVSGAASAGGQAVLSKARDLNATAIAQIALKAKSVASKLPDSTAAIVDFASKSVIAPNTNTTFSNSSVRSFSFQFKLISRTSKEADNIRDILQVFQMKMYPEGGNEAIILKYPPTFSINFYNGNGEENEYLPGIFTSYLTGMTSTFNSSTNMYHKDGSPLESDVTLQFQEIKALNREEITNLLPG